MLKDKEDPITQSDTMTFKSIAVKSEVKARIKREKGKKTYSKFLEDLLDKKFVSPIIEENQTESRIEILWKRQKELEGRLLRLEANFIKR